MSNTIKFANQLLFDFPSEGKASRDTTQMAGPSTIISICMLTVR